MNQPCHVMLITNTTHYCNQALLARQDFDPGIYADAVLQQHQRLLPTQFDPHAAGGLKKKKKA